MAFRANVVNVSTAATSLTGATAANQAGMSVLVKNTGTAEVRVGGPEVTWAAGYPIPAGEVLATDTASPLYAIAQSGTTTVNVLLANV